MANKNRSNKKNMKVISQRRGRPRKSSMERVLDASPINLNSISEQKNMIARRFRKNPMAMYILGGVGSFFLGKYLLRYYRENPEISEFVRENFENIESKLQEYRGKLWKNGSEEVTHH